MLILANGGGVSVHLLHGGRGTDVLFEVRCGPHSRTSLGKILRVGRFDAGIVWSGQRRVCAVRFLPCAQCVLAV